jgi:hypothetical protein
MATEQYKLRGIVRYASVVEPSGAKGFDKTYYGITLLIHKNDPQIKKMKQWCQDEIANSTKEIQKRSEQDNFALPFQQLNEAEGPLSDYYEVRVRTAYADKNGKVRKKPTTHVLIEDTRATHNIDDPEYEREMTGKIAHVAFSIGTWEIEGKEKKAGLNFYYYRGLVSDSLMGDIEPEYLRATGGIADTFADEIAEESSKEDTQPVARKGLPPKPTGLLKKHQMTSKAELTYDEYKEAGYTDEDMIQEGWMLPPNRVKPKFI